MVLRKWNAGTLLRRVSLGVMAAAVVVACSGAPAGPINGPHDESAELRPDLIEVEPSVVAPGEELSVFFPTEEDRGIHFALEKRVGETWDLVYHLISDWGDGRETHAYPPADWGEIAIEDIGIVGPGPDVVRIPEDVESGEYRVCTGNTRPNFCAQVTVEGEG